MPLFGRKRTGNHSVQVITFDDDGPPAFVAMCTCGTISMPFPTQDEAFGWARDHSPNVNDDVELLRGEGGVGWQCMFCGSAIEEAPLRISVSWTDDGVDDEQWYAAHRGCLVERMSEGEQFSPRFRLAGGEAA